MKKLSRIVKAMQKLGPFVPGTALVVKVEGQAAGQVASKLMQDAREKGHIPPKYPVFIVPEQWTMIQVNQLVAMKAAEKEAAERSPLEIPKPKLILPE
mgnify:CR=1 FL=1